MLSIESRRIISDDMICPYDYTQLESREFCDAVYSILLPRAIQYFQEKYPLVPDIQFLERAYNDPYVFNPTDQERHLIFKHNIPPEILSDLGIMMGALLSAAYQITQGDPAKLTPGILTHLMATVTVEDYKQQALLHWITNPDIENDDAPSRH